MKISAEIEENRKTININKVGKDEFGFILENLIDHIDIDHFSEAEKERDFEGWEIKEAVRGAIEDFSVNYLPNNEAEKYDPECVNSAGDCGVKIIHKMAETMINETEVYESYAAMVAAVQIACRYMWERSKKA